MRAVSVWSLLAMVLWASDLARGPRGNRRKAIGGRLFDPTGCVFVIFGDNQFVGGLDLLKML